MEAGVIRWEARMSAQSPRLIVAVCLAIVVVTGIYLLVRNH
jgi:preprotein translocase subunit Sec61beta